MNRKRNISNCRLGNGSGRNLQGGLKSDDKGITTAVESDFCLVGQKREDFEDKDHFS